MKLGEAIRWREKEPSENTKLSDEQIVAWAERHDVSGPIVDLRCMIEDARSLLPGDAE